MSDIRNNNQQSNNRIYVVGHINPDTDSIAAALGYAWLLNQRDGVDAIAARAGSVNRQTAFVLKTLALDPPSLLTDVSPRFESVMRRYDTITPDKPLSQAWLILSRTGGLAPVVNPDNTPYGIVTGQSIFDFLHGLVGPHLRRNDLTLSSLLEIPCRNAAATDNPRFQAGTRIKDVLNRTLRSEQNEYWVLDENKRYLGITRKWDLLNPPRIKLVLVDHNEPQQSVASLDEAELIEILDHHRLGNPSTHQAIKFTVDVVGSTSTLVSEQMEESGYSAPPALAGVLLAGLLSDTLILQSPTTTQRDRDAADRLARWAFVPGTPLAGESAQTWGEKVLKAGAGLITQEPDAVVRTDMKLYDYGVFRFAISQAETSEMSDLGDYTARLFKSLKNLKNEKGLDFTILMVTDIVKNSSQILMMDAPAELDELPYDPQPDGTLFAPGVVSRKKQLLPLILSLLEE